MSAAVFWLLMAVSAGSHNGGTTTNVALLTDQRTCLYYAAQASKLKSTVDFICVELPQSAKVLP